MNLLTPQAATRLCAGCGMCCNGTLFHLVRIQPGDNPRALESLGLKIKGRKSHQPHFKQPCPAHRDSQCTIYGDRPARCRLFECRQLKQVDLGEITEAQAQARIDEALRQVTGIRELLGAAGDNDGHKPLAQRYDNLMADPASADQATLDQLTAAMQELKILLDSEFRAP
jgi:hypothetical protein